MKPHWIVLANTQYARLLQQEEGAAPVIVQGFTHSPGPGKKDTRFAHELGEHLERNAQLGNFGSLAVFASNPFLLELKSKLGPATLRLLSRTHDVDLTNVGPAELQRRISYELAQ